MDFQKCLEILNSRPSGAIDSNLRYIGNFDTTDTTDTTIGILSIEQPTDTINRESGCGLITTVPTEQLRLMESIALVNRFRGLQEMRISTYQFFNRELDNIIQCNTPNRYPPICTDITKTFTDISTQINSIRDVLKDRQLTEFSQYITSIQGHEKNKLIYVAAQHLDKLQDTVTELNTFTGGKTVNQVLYLANKIKETEVLISENMENIMCLLSDLTEVVS